MSDWIGWQIEHEDLFEAADAISSDAEPLGAAAASIIAAHPYVAISNVLLIDRMHFDQQWRGKRLTGAIIDDLVALLRFEPVATVVVLQPEPQQPTGGLYNNDIKRDEAHARLTAAYLASGLEPWHGSSIWWRNSWAGPPQSW